jgi:DNA-binding transcriptional MerR regulator
MDTGNDWVGIRQLADRLALSLSTLHYWERRGLIDAHRRGRQRYYDPEQAHRATLIRLWQDRALMSLDEIAAVLAGRTESTTWREVINGRIGAIDTQLDQLRAARAHLAHMLSCPRENPALDCPKLRKETARVAFNPR